MELFDPIRLVMYFLCVRTTSASPLILTRRFPLALSYMSDLVKLTGLSEIRESPYRSELKTALGRDEYTEERFSSRSTATSASLSIMRFSPIMESELMGPATFLLGFITQNMPVHPTISSFMFQPVLPLFTPLLRKITYIPNYGFSRGTWGEGTRREPDPIGPDDV